MTPAGHPWAEPTHRRHGTLCALCGMPGGTTPRMHRDRSGARWADGWVHAVCRDRQAEVARRRTAAKLARKWEAAGQQVLAPLTDGEV